MEIVALRSSVYNLTWYTRRNQLSQVERMQLTHSIDATRSTSCSVATGVLLSVCVLRETIRQTVTVFTPFLERNNYISVCLTLRTVDEF